MAKKIELKREKLSPAKQEAKDKREVVSTFSFGRDNYMFILIGIGVLVLGYLLLSKLVNISQEEDCALAHRYNCGAVEVPR